MSNKTQIDRSIAAYIFAMYPNIQNWPQHVMNQLDSQSRLPTEVLEYYRSLKMSVTDVKPPTQPMYQAPQTNVSAMPNSVCNQLPNIPGYSAFNPLTPPGLPSASMAPLPNNALAPTWQFLTDSSQAHDTQMWATELQLNSELTPGTTPRNSPQSNSVNVSAASSRSNSPTPSNSSDYIVEEYNDDKFVDNEIHRQFMEDLYRPICNNHGVLKMHKCKKCDFTHPIKAEIYKHKVTHLDPQKVIHCPRCVFGTDLKHHMQYHLYKHSGIKPYKCKYCKYDCANKSMIMSHLKSHSKVFQYRCGTCKYTSKYCHALKLHLRATLHTPGTMLTKRGQPDPSIIVDVYGTKRGPREKTVKSKKSQPKAKKVVQNINAPEKQEVKEQTQVAMQQPIQPMSWQVPATNNAPTTPAVYPSAPSEISRTQHQQPALMTGKTAKTVKTEHVEPTPEVPNVSVLWASVVKAMLSKELTQSSQPMQSTIDWNQSMQLPIRNEEQATALDLSPSSSFFIKKEACGTKQFVQQETPVVSTQNKLRRRRVLHLEQTPQSSNGTISPESDTSLPAEVPASSHSNGSSPPSNCGSNNQILKPQPVVPPQQIAPTEGSLFECRQCDTLFRNPVLYALHMSYHNSQEAYKCPRCGLKFDGCVTLLMHICKVRES